MVRRQKKWMAGRWGALSFLLVLSAVGCATTDGRTIPEGEPPAASSSPEGGSFGNLIPNSDFRTDGDADGVPDGWIPGSTPSVVRDSATGIGPVGGEEESGALWILGGRDRAGSWSVRVRGIEPGRTYLLSFGLFREAFQDGWYPEVEVFGERIYLNQNTTYGGWQPVEILVRAPVEAGSETWFRFLNRYPCRFWLHGPSLRPYRIAWVPGAGDTEAGGVEWLETVSNLTLRMELSVTDAGGRTERHPFLDAEVERVQVGGPDGPAAAAVRAPWRLTGAYRCRAWVPLEGKAPFVLRLDAYFEGRRIDGIEREGVRPGKESSATLRASPLPVLGAPAVVPQDLFPIGIFNAPLDQADRVVGAGFNAVVLDPRAGPPDADSLRRMADLPLRWVLPAGNLPTGEKGLAEVGHVLGKSLLCLYAADEPELGGVAPLSLLRVRDRVRGVLPRLPMAAAVVRARFVPYYRYACDWFLLDPYPVPNRPLTWLSDSLDRAKQNVEAGRCMAVIQAFGGEEQAVRGWDRFPTLEEMRALAFLAVVHGARGVFFYDYASAAGSQPQWETVTRVVKDLVGVDRWLRPSALRREPEVWCLGPEGWQRNDGRVRCVVLEEQKDEPSRVLICVNPTERAMEVLVRGIGGAEDRVLVERLRGRPVVLSGGALVDTLPPRAASVYTDG